MLKRLVNVVEVIALVAVAATVVMLFANEPDEPAAPVATEVAEDGGAVAGVDGAALYASRCASCHGDDGTGGFAPQLGEGRIVEVFPDEADQVEVVTAGRGGMPAFGDRLSPEEIAAIVAYTRTEL